MKTFLETAEERYSVRAFRPDAVEDEKITAMLHAARLAPTACNNQPQKIYVVKNEELRAKLAKVTPCTYGAPVIFVVCFDETVSAKGKVVPGYDFGYTDAAIVCTHLMFEAHEQGLGSCWVGWFAEDDVKQALSLPENIRVADLLPVGYPAEDAKPAALHTSKKPLSETTVIL